MASDYSSWEKKMFKAQAFFFGKHNMVIFEDIFFFINKISSFPQHQEAISQCETKAQHNLIGSSALAVGLNLSLQRYFPNSFGGRSLNKVLIDIIFITLCVNVCFMMTMSRIEEQLIPIKKDVVSSLNKEYLMHMNDVEKKYGISHKLQLGNVMKDLEEFSKWELKKERNLGYIS